MVCVTVLVGSTNGKGGGRVDSHAAMPASGFGKQSRRLLANERGVGATLKYLSRRKKDGVEMAYGALMTDG